MDISEVRKALNKEYKDLEEFMMDFYFEVLWPYFHQQKVIKQLSDELGRDLTDKELSEIKEGGSGAELFENLEGIFERKGLNPPDEDEWYTDIEEEWAECANFILDEYFGDLGPIGGNINEYEQLKGIEIDGEMKETIRSEIKDQLDVEI